MIFDSIKISDCLEKVVDNRGKTPECIENGIPLIEINAIAKDNRYPNYSVIKKYVSEEIYQNFRSGNPKKNDVLIGTVGTIGSIALMDDTKASIAQNLIALRTKNTINSKWFYYALINSMNEILSLNIGGVQPSIKVPHLMNLVINVPEKSNQDKIAYILDTIDKKIETNNRIVQDLYLLGDLLYEQTYLKNSNNIDFHDYLLKDVAENYDSKRKPLSSRERSDKQGSYPYYGATSIIDYIDDYIFDGIYILMGEDGTVVTDKGTPVLQYIWGKNWINNHAHVLKGKVISTEHLLFALRSVNIRHLITGAVQLKINQENMNRIIIPLADDSFNKEFDSKIEIIMNNVRNALDENNKLRNLKNIILPKLMSGKIDISGIKCGDINE